MKYASVVLIMLCAAPAVAQAPEQPDRPVIPSSKERLIRPGDTVDGLYREPYTGGGVLNRGPYLGGGQIYDLTPQPAQGAAAATDWSKPVTGVDSLVLPGATSTEEVRIPLMAITQGQTARLTPDNTPQPPPCEEPPVASANSAKPPPAPCPPPPR